MYLLQATVSLILHMKHPREFCKFSLFLRLSDNLMLVLSRSGDTISTEKYSFSAYLYFGKFSLGMENSLDFPEITENYDEVIIALN